MEFIASSSVHDSILSSLPISHKLKSLSGSPLCYIEFALGPAASSYIIACRYNRILVTSIFFHDRSDLEAYNMCTYMTPFFSDFLMSTNSFLKK